MAEVAEVKTVEKSVDAPESATASTITEESKMTGDQVKQDDEKERKGRARRQIEFYFADSNLPYDKFMWQLHTKDNEHWVPVETVASFKRMREYSKDGLEWVTDALRESELLEVDASGTKVRRRTEVKEPQGQFERSVYAKGFGDEDPTLQSRLEKFFQGYGSTNEVRMRREQDKSFKGSVFVEFTEPSGVDAFLKADPKPSWDGKELLIMTKEAYCEMKIKEKGLTGKDAERKKGIMTKRAFNAFKTPVSQGGLLADGDVHMDDGSLSKTKKEIYLEYFGKKLLIYRDSSGNGRVKDEEVPYTKGATLKFEGVGDNFSWNDIKTPLRDLFEGKVPFIDYTRGQNSGLVGFHREISDDDILAVQKAVRTINGNTITWSKIEEEEEKTFQIRRAQSSARNALRNTEGENSSGGRGGGRGGARGGRGGRGGRDRGRGRGRGGSRGGRSGGADRGETNGKDKATEKSDASGSGSADGSANGAGADNDAQVGDKRKRAIEPDGGPDVGLRGQDAPPKIQTVTAPKKVKTETGELPSPVS